MMWYWQKNKQISEPECSPGIDACNDSQLISDKGAKAIQWRNSYCNKFLEQVGHPHVKQWVLTDIPFRKFNSKEITDINVNAKLKKLLEGNTGENLDDLEFGDEFLETSET